GEGGKPGRNSADDRAHETRTGRDCLDIENQTPAGRGRHMACRSRVSRPGPGGLATDVNREVYRVCRGQLLPAKMNLAPGPKGFGQRLQMVVGFRLGLVRVVHSQESFFYGEEDHATSPTRANLERHGIELPALGLDGAEKGATRRSAAARLDRRGRKSG